jgi:hypothetical protein
MTIRAGGLPLALLAALSVSANAQTMSVNASVEVPAPDSLAYEAGASLPASFNLVVTECTGTLGCQVTIENPVAASPVPIELQWRLTGVNQVGAGSLGCQSVAPLLTWQDLSLSPVVIMDTGTITEPGTGCAAGVEVRAVNLSYADHQHTTPSTTYWRELVFRTADK